MEEPDNRGSLKARVTPQKDSKDPCLVAPDAKYRGQENQLYRIEIHRGVKGVKRVKQVRQLLNGQGIMVR